MKQTVCTFKHQYHLKNRYSIASGEGQAEQSPLHLPSYIQFASDVEQFLTLNYIVKKRMEGKKVQKISNPS